MRERTATQFTSSHPRLSTPRHFVISPEMGEVVTLHKLVAQVAARARAGGARIMGPIPGAGSATSGRPPTRLLAVMAADVVDYTRLTEAAELETHVRLRALRVGIIDPCVVSYRGHIIKNTGDGFLATFDSSVDALRCAVEIQREIPLREASTPLDLKIRFRIGLNVGEVITEEEDVYGTSVNVAARLEQFSPPGGIVISDALHAIARSRMDDPRRASGLVSARAAARSLLPTLAWSGRQ